MKLKHQVATLAALIALAGCSPSDQSTSEKQANAPSPNREAHDQQKDTTLATSPPKDAAPVPGINAPSPAAKPEAPAPAYPPTVAITPPAPSPTLKDTALETKDEFITAMDKKLKDLDAKITELTEKSKGYQSDAKTQADQALATLREQRDKANQKFEQAKTAAADAWKDMKGGVELALNQLETAYENAKSKFN